jgi:hypothetical protein
MNRKVFGIALVFLSVVVLATPLVSNVSAKKTIYVFEQTPGVDPPTYIPVSEELGDVFKISGDGHMTIRSGTLRTFIYAGPLGIGTATLETMISISNCTGEIVSTPMGELPVIADGHGIYNFTLTITDGPWEGTIWGYANCEWEWDFSGFPRYEYWTTFNLKHGTSDFEGLRVDIEEYFTLGNLMPPYPGNWHLKTTVTTPD